MIAFEIEQIRSFMQQLLLRDVFDRFLVTDVSITTFATFQIDGHLHPEFFRENSDSEVPQPARTLASWAELKPYCLSVIRGKHTPLSFQIVFQLSDEETAALLREEGLSSAQEEISGLYLNCRFRDNRLLLTSGVSLTGFDPSRSAERAWDAHLTRMLQTLGLV